MSVLDENDFEARHIMAHTGHKSESSIRQYISKCPPKKRREMSACLAKSLVPDQTSDSPIVNPNPPQATVSTPNENTNVADIDWLEIDPHEISDNQLVDVLTQIEVSNVNLAVPSTSTSNPQNSANNYK